MEEVVAPPKEDHVSHGRVIGHRGCVTGGWTCCRGRVAPSRTVPRPRISEWIEVVVPATEEDHVPGGRVIGHRGGDAAGGLVAGDDWLQVVPFQVQVSPRGLTLLARPPKRTMFPVAGS